MLDEEPARALAQEWVDLAKTTCGDLIATECEGLDALAAGIAGSTWLGFDEDAPGDRIIVMRFHVAGKVYVPWAEDRFVDPAGYVMD